jgi:hypothetical protein
MLFCCAVLCCAVPSRAGLPRTSSLQTVRPLRRRRCAGTWRPSGGRSRYGRVRYGRCTALPCSLRFEGHPVCCCWASPVQCCALTLHQPCPSCCAGVLLQYGGDPALLDMDEDPYRCLNFDWARYAPHLATLRQARKYSDLQAAIKAMRDEGTVALLATGGKAKGAASAAGGGGAAAAAAPPPAGGGAPAAAATGRAGPASPGGGRGGGVALQQPRGGSDFKGVYGKGPWIAQIALRQNKVGACEGLGGQRSCWLCTACHAPRVLWRTWHALLSSRAPAQLCQPVQEFPRLRPPTCLSTHPTLHTGAADA